MFDDFELPPDAVDALKCFDPATQSQIIDKLYELLPDPYEIGSPSHRPYPPCTFIYKFESDDGGDTFDLVAVYQPDQTGPVLQIEALVTNEGPVMV